MILLDTSAWVEFLRGTGSPTAAEVRRLLARDTACCDAIRMEVLAGARHEAHLRQLEALLDRSTRMTTEPEDFEVAAGLFRTCRQSGVTVRKLIDCLIAATAIRCAVPVLALDADFELLAQHTELELHRPRGRSG